jgi:hypothetical protein
MGRCSRMGVDRLTHRKFSLALSLYPFSVRLAVGTHKLVLSSVPIADNRSRQHPDNQMIEREFISATSLPPSALARIGYVDSQPFPKPPRPPQPAAKVAEKPAQDHPG